MLTTTAKDWLAENAGINSCFASSGISYRDPDGISRTGGTGDVLNAFVVAHMVGKDYAVIISNTHYSSLKSKNSNQDMSIDDVSWVYNNDGTGAEQKYCVSGVVPTPTPTPTPTPSPTPTPTTCVQLLSQYGAFLQLRDKDNNGRIGTTEISLASYDKNMGNISADEYNAVEKAWQMGCVIPKDGVPPTPTPTPTPPTTPTPTPYPGVTPVPPSPDIAGVFVFRGPITGEPSVSLDLSQLKMRQAADGHFEMNDIVIHSGSQHPIHLAMRVRLFPGTLSYCPTGYAKFDGMDRTSGRNKRVKILEAGESATYDADFYQPTSIIGPHTVCLLIHGAWTNADLDDEIESITG